MTSRRPLRQSASMNSRYSFFLTRIAIVVAVIAVVTPVLAAHDAGRPLLPAFVFPAGACLAGVLTAFVITAVMERRHGPRE